MTLSIVQKQVGAAANGIDHEIQIAIAIDVRKRGARTIQIGASNASRRRNVFETPIAQVSIKNIRAVQSAEIDIGQTVSIDIARGHPRTIQKDLIRQMALLGEDVRENDPGSGGGHCEQ